MTAPDQAAFAYVGAFVDELARAGVRHVCVAPGSRSTPLALTIAGHPALHTWVHLDERSAAFFALGMARALGAPVALLCTSGTAAANFLPAIVEARSAGVPLLVLTADRPPELRDVGAPQTIDQNGLFGVHAKWFVDVALPEATPALVRYARTLAGRAAALAAAAPAGPVHLNFPFREPLVPAPVAPPAGMSDGDELAWHGRPDGAPWVTVTHARATPAPETVRWLAAQLRAARRPLLVCGPQPDPALAAPLAALARALHAPLLADPLSQLRWGAHDRCAVIDRYDAALRDGATAAELVPDLVVRLGAPPTSRALQQYLQRHAAARQVVV
ncbi:MAG TPA: 2-succinyl-5-enolpyruvyl-6-hydroxy-3-cyclohexene-1-carboxylic-acid synthase, partial [Gemmatimonadaceae bacterium]|nr:2-succinyl-5-enolpyruvyl-6-hydroxy-3-cyclohexene-1-carboxylic-acid synthase [Gemmatimonadaceae bacterium]